MDGVEFYSYAPSKAGISPRDGPYIIIMTSFIGPGTVGIWAPKLSDSNATNNVNVRVNKPGFDMMRRDLRTLDHSQSIRTLRI